MHNVAAGRSIGDVQTRGDIVDLQEKYFKLREILRSLGNVAVAFSGGVDSTFLLKTAHDVLGDQAIAVTACSAAFPQREKNEAENFCETYGIRQVFCTTDILNIEGFRENPQNRCYLCKREIFREIQAASKSCGIEYVAEGSNMDDMGDYRPGMAAIRELGVLSPLRMAGLYKAEIRELSKRLGLPTWRKPSYACLATRIAYGEEITAEKLRMIDRAEQVLLDLGFEQMRVRLHGAMARIEVLPEAIGRLTEAGIRAEIVGKFKDLGFAYVTVDLQGYRTGSMNETIRVDESE